MSIYSRASLLCYPTMCYNKLVSKARKKDGFNCLPSSTTPVMEMLEDIISMKSNAKDVCHTL